MPRIKGKAKGEQDHDHGTIRDDVKLFLENCRTLPALHRECQRSVKRRAISRAEARQFLDGKNVEVITALLTALGGRDVRFFLDIAQRIGANNPHQPVDVVAANILAIWRFTIQPIDGSTSRGSIPFPELRRKLEECIPGLRFSDAKLRAKAKALGVVFPAGGRPKKT